MRTYLTLTLFVFLSVPGVRAQVSLIAIGGYTFSDNFQLDPYSGKIYDGAHYGGILEYNVKIASIELAYQRQDPTVTVHGLNVNERGTVHINYLTLGGARFLPINSDLSGFVGINAGMAIVGNEENDDRITRFAWGAKLGLRQMINDRIGVQFHGQVMSIVQGSGGSVFVGTGGAGVGISLYSSIYQFGLTGGLVFTLSD